MAFEFFFGLFGLISSDSRTRHKSRLENDWRLFTPLSTSLFKDAQPNGPASDEKPASAKSGGQQQAKDKSLLGSGAGQPAARMGESADASFLSLSPSARLPSNPTPRADNPFSSSNSSIGSSTGSISTINSSASLIKPAARDAISGVDSLSGKKFDFGAGFAGVAKGAAGGQLGSLSANVAQAQADEQREKEGARGAESEGAGGSRFGRRSREIYCRLVCLFLWLNVLRTAASLYFEKSFFTLDFHYMGVMKATFQIPALCIGIQVAAVSSIFIRNNEETNWLVPFYSSKDYLIRSRSNFRPRMKDYTRRVNISVMLSLFLATVSSLSLSAYFMRSGLQSDALWSLYQAADASAAPSDAASALGSVSWERMSLLFLLVNDVLWAVYSTFICFLVSFYFNLICSIMKARFHYISKIIEDLAESNTRKTTNQARKITTLYLEHNEACELLDESNDFWQYLILFTYFTYIPAYCYCLYNLFFVDFAPWPHFITWVIHTHMAFIILLISFSAAGVSTEVSHTAKLPRCAGRRLGDGQIIRSSRAGGAAWLPNEM